VDGEIASQIRRSCAYKADRHLRDLKATGKSELASAGVRYLLDSRFAKHIHAIEVHAVVGKGMGGNY
jgi:hypothetical protein